MSELREPLAAGVRLPELKIEVTSTLIVAGALMTQDYQRVHHDRDAAQLSGADDIFMNILTSNGLLERYVVFAIGPKVAVHRIALRLGDPAYPGDTLKVNGEVNDWNGYQGILSVRGATHHGEHVTANIMIEV